MKRMIICVLTLCALSHAKADEISTEKKQPTVEELSQAFGHMIGQNLESLGFEFDMQNVLKGLQDSIAGKDSPLSEPETVEAITKIQEEAFNKQSENNLKVAEDFLTSNAKQEGVVEIEKSKLQYKIIEEGNGAVVQPHFNPLIRYKGRFADGQEFGASQDSEQIALDETIPGFAQGIIGMQEGEKRTLYIHPDSGYGTSGFLPPNSLLVFDIEVVKADAPKEGEALTSVDASENEEIALPKQDLDNQTPIR